MLLFALFALLVSLVSALNCPSGGAHQCVSVSNNYNYVTCDDGVCRCRSELGFSGDATAASKCSCQHAIHWEAGTPYCLSYANAIADAAANEREQRLEGIVNNLYTSLIWPTAGQLAQKVLANDLTGNVFDDVDESVRGRADPLYDFEGKKEFVVFHIGQIWLQVVKVNQIWVNKLVAQGNQVAFDIDVLFTRYENATSSNVVYEFNLTHTGVITFNGQDKIISMDLTLRNVQLAVEEINPQNNATLQSVCGTILYAGCGSYASMQDCVDILYTKSFGTWDNIRDDSVFCRRFHATYALLTPALHCPATTSSGGDFCREHTRQERYSSTY